MNKLTTEEFIEKSHKVHGNKYSYDKTKYTIQKNKVIIICPIHGEFEQLPNNHLKGKGCPKCAHEKLNKINTYSLQEFIEKSNYVHNFKYDYSKVNYTKASDQVIIICPIHGEFKQRASDHLQGKGCYKCNGGKKYTNEEFIEKARQIHGNKYEYSKVEYINSTTKVCIICPEHGEFWQTPGSHINKKAGCPKCYIQSKGEISILKWLQQNNILFKQQFSININKEVNKSGKAYVDFYLPKYNLIIEYNGIQHYVPIDYFGGQMRLNQQKERDNQVRQFCINNGIKLLEISYKDNIEEKLEQIIN